MRGPCNRRCVVVVTIASACVGVSACGSSNSKSTAKASVGKTGPEILACLQQAGLPPDNFGGDPQAISVGAHIGDTELLVFSSPDQAAAGVPQYKAQWPAGYKVIGNVIVGYRKVPAASARTKIEGCA